MSGALTMIDSPTFGRFTFDAVFSVDHSANVTITTHPVQAGAAVADHAYMEPDEVTMDIGMTDAMVGVETNHSVNAYTQLREIMAKREPVTLVTRLKTYQNMVITSISAPDDVKTMHALRASIYFSQVNIVNVSIVRVQEITTSSKKTSSSSSSSSKSSSGGGGGTKTSSTKKTTKSTTSSNKSVLRKLADKLGL